MGIVQKYSNAFPDPAAFPPNMTAPGLKHCKEFVTQALVAVANGDSATSQLFIARVPSHARMAEGSLLEHSAITGLTDVDFGGDNDVDGLADGLTMATAGSKSAYAAVTLANRTKRLWELLGYTVDPGGDLALYLTLNVDAGAAGTILATLRYTTD